jgi:hypothetical protein
VVVELFVLFVRFVLIGVSPSGWSQTWWLTGSSASG